MHEIIKPSLVLFAITLIAAALLGTISEMTKEPIEQNKLQTKQASMSKVLPLVTDNNFGEEQAITNAGYVTAYSEGFSGNEQVGMVVSVVIGGYSGMIEILVGLDMEDNITGIDLIQQTETPGLGANADKEKFTDLYIGKNDILSVTKSANPSENEIVAITSATITSKAVTEAVNSAIEFAKGR